MNYWLMKTEPETFGWNDLVKDGKTTWDGVRNYAARNHMQAMKKGDKVFIYHSVIGKEIVGIGKISKEAFQDPSSDDPRWISVEVVPDKPLKKPVTLESVKAEPELQNLMLVRQGRLSVMPVTPEEFNKILEMSK
jgi:predicted RNA-binding protein with PUA-like domain